MRIAVCSDEPYRVHDVLVAEIERHGHQVQRFGSLATGTEQPWAIAAEAAAQAVASGSCDQGVFLCWTGTGICMAANKVAGIRAALCTEPGTVQGARIWNHANVLCLSNRLLSDEMAKEMIAAWFETDQGTRGANGVDLMNQVDARHRRLLP